MGPEDAAVDERAPSCPQLRSVGQVLDERKRIAPTDVAQRRPECACSREPTIPRFSCNQTRFAHYWISDENAQCLFVRCRVFMHTAIHGVGWFSVGVVEHQLGEGQGSGLCNNHV